MQELTPIHLVDGNSKTLVFVNPEKTYGNQTGRELIETFATKQKQKPQKSKRDYALTFFKHPANPNIEVNGESTIARGKLSDLLKFIAFEPQAIIRKIQIHLTPELRESLLIGRNHYNTRRLILIYQDIHNKQIISRYTPNKPLKWNVNTTIELLGIWQDDNEDLPLVIIGKKEGLGYLLAKYLSTED